MENTIPVTVTLLVKAPDQDAGERFVLERLSRWMTEPGFNHAIPGEGYPYGSLLHYSIRETEG